MAEDTLVIFTSDNGPWLTQLGNGGSSGLLREGKASTWEGGVRVPAIAWWPGKIAGGQVVRELASALDIFPTFVHLAGAQMPSDRPIDGYDLTSVLLKGARSPRDEFFYYQGEELFAVRKGPFKAHFKTQAIFGQKLESHDPPLLFNLRQDPSEKYDVASSNAAILTQIQHLARDHQATVSPVENQLRKGLQTEAAWKPLFNGKNLTGWKISEFAGHGEVGVEEFKGGPALILGQGVMTGVTFTNEFPTMNYEIALEAMRVSGSDFFCGLTFPVGEEPCSFIVGGWGGGVVGISSLDGMDASENETTRYTSFDTGRWYAIRLRVLPGKIQAWIDEELIVDVNTKGKRISIRPEVEESRPLGIASWSTKAALRNVRYRRLP